MAESLTLDAFRGALKEHYTKDEMIRLAYEDHPFLALVPKDEAWKGSDYIIPIQFVTPQGRSHTFATAQANTKPGGYDRFVLTTSKDYGIIHIDNETILASEGMPAEYFVQSRKSEIDGIFISLGNSMSTDLFRNGGGARGQVSGLSGGNTILTLLNADDVVNFEVGMKIVGSDNDGSATGHALLGGTAVEITGIDRDAGTLTAADWTAITGLGANDYLFVEGDFKAALKGLEAWVPPNAPGATAFFGVDRTQEVSRLGGLRYSDSNPLIEKLQRAWASGARHGARFTHGFMNPMDWAELEISLGDKCRYDVVKDEDGVFGFDAIIQRTPKGNIAYLADASCPKDVIWHLQLNTWKLCSRGPAPTVLDADGVGDFLRQQSADGIEGRFGYYGQLGCHAPGYNQRVSLT